MYIGYKNRMLLCVLLFLTSEITGLQAQDFSSLVQMAWDNDSWLKSKAAQSEAAGYSLKESKSLYMPVASLGAQYTLAAGGRSIDLPVGDLLNPVYSALNGLTMSNQFPNIPNVKEQFLPNNFYDARLRVTQPVYQPEIKVLQEVRKVSLDMKDLEVKAYKRQLSREVMVAYFQWEAARQAIKIYKAGDTLVQESKRVTKSLIQNGAGLPSALNRVESQEAQLQASVIEAQAQINNAKNVLGFWIGQESFEPVSVPELPELTQMQKMEREELAQIELGKKLQNLALEKENKFYLPKAGAQLDVGTQDFNFGFEPYVLLGLNVEWNIFDVGKHKNRRSAIVAESRSLELQKEFATRQLDLQYQVAGENLNASIMQAQTYKNRIEANDRLYNDVLKKYKEGTANYIELLDAQTQVTQIRLQYNLARQNAWIKWADFVYASANYPID